MIDLLLINGYVVTMNKERELISNGAIAVHANKIVEVGQTNVLIEKYEAKKVLDCTNHCILPGFIDAHGHGGHSMFKTVAMDYQSQWMPVMTETYNHFVTDEFWYYEGLLSALERLKAGITTGVSVLGSQPRSDEPVFAINHARAYSEVGVREVIATGPQNPPWPKKFSKWIDGRRIEKDVTYKDALLGTEAVIESLNNTSNGLIKAFVTPFVIVTSVNPSYPTSPDQLYGLTDHDLLQAKEVRKIAKKYNSRIHSDAFGGMIHLASKDKENALLGPDVHLQHCRGISFDEALILAETGTNVSASPSYGQIPARTPITELIDLGVNVAISTDGSSPAAPFDMFQSIRKMQLINQAALKDYYYLPPGKLLEMVTIDAAKCLGAENELGSIEPDKFADIIAVKMDSAHLTPNYMYIHRLIHQAVASDVNHVIVNGEIIMENRKACNVDEKKIISDANLEGKETVKRAGLQKYMNSAKDGWGKSRLYPDSLKFESNLNKE